ncbi:hypothetical protein [Hyalangium versicolor]|uniref:hypothetical protein n=1 Tax=Hyalangium versicolor TaxID=2861190 RepID=UPI001CCEDE3D|nr:hypothetical protein [Hyalangium versicolor]
MRWLQVAAGTLAALSLTGCPSEFGKDGRVNRATKKDMLELVRHHCDKDEYERYCGGYKKDTQMCRDHCGE